MTSGPVPGTDASHALVDEPVDRTRPADGRRPPSPLARRWTPRLRAVAAPSRRGLRAPGRAHGLHGMPRLVPQRRARRIRADRRNRVRRGAAEASGGLIAGIVGHADLRLANLDAVLDAHVEAGAGLFRGIRHALSRAESDDLMIRAARPPDCSRTTPSVPASPASASAASRTTPGTTTRRTTSSSRWPARCPTR